VIFHLVVAMLGLVASLLFGQQTTLVISASEVDIAPLPLSWPTLSGSIGLIGAVSLHFVGGIVGGIVLAQREATLCVEPSLIRLVACISVLGIVVNFFVFRYWMPKMFRGLNAVLCGTEGALRRELLDSGEEVPTPAAPELNVFTQEDDYSAPHQARLKIVCVFQAGFQARWTFVLG
jgi:hypothetical protein